MIDKDIAIVAGIGPGLGKSLCTRLCAEGYAVVGLARSAASGQELERELQSKDQSFRFVECDVTNAAAVERTVQTVTGEWGAPSTLIYNAGQLLIKPFVETTADDFERMWRVTALGAMLTSSAVIPGMISAGRGAIIFTGATAGMRGGAKFSAFASAKFALRGLAQSLAREHGPLGIHVVHAVLDGIMWGGISRDMVKAPREACIEPDAVAEVYLQLMRQEKSAWTQEIDLRPSSESF